MTTEHCLRALSPVLCKGMANGSCLRDSGINPGPVCGVSWLSSEESPSRQTNYSVWLFSLLREKLSRKLLLVLALADKIFESLSFLRKNRLPSCQRRKEGSRNCFHSNPPEELCIAFVRWLGGWRFCGLGGEQQLGRTVAWKQEDYVLLLKSIPEALSARRWRSKLCLECFQEGIVSLKVLWRKCCFDGSLK